MNTLLQVGGVLFKTHGVDGNPPFKTLWKVHHLGITSGITSMTTDMTHEFFYSVIRYAT